VYVKDVEPLDTPATWMDGVYCLNVARRSAGARLVDLAGYSTAFKPRPCLAFAFGLSIRAASGRRKVSSSCQRSPRFCF